MKRKLLSAVLALSLLLSLCACGETPAEGGETQQTPQSGTEQQAPVSDDIQVAHGYNGVVAAADPVAAQVGLDILKAGGNAADAAIATAFALGLTENAASGIGGSGLMLYYDAAEKKTYSIDYYFACPAAMEASDFVDATAQRNSGMGGVRAVVPGFVAGMTKANEMFSTMTMEQLLAPAIKLAEEGVEVTAFMAENYLDYYDRILLYPETMRVFTDEGFPYGEGSVFKNPDLAKTMRIIAEQGRDGFYTGEVAEAIVDSQRATGSKMTLDDLANYEAVVTEALSSSYRGHKVVAMPPVSGGAVVLSMLNLAEHFDIASMERDSAEYLHTWGEVMRIATSDYTTYFEDPSLYDVMPSIRGIISKEYAADRVKLFSASSTMEIGPVGDPNSYDPESHTTHLSVVDKDGNIVSMTNTNGDFFGTLTTVTDYGFVIENTTAFSGGSTYVPEAGKRGRSPMSPTIVFNEDGTPLMAIGTPGSGRIMATVALTISNMIDYEMDLKSAVDAPRLYQGRNGALTVEGGFSDALTSELEALGHDVAWRVSNDSYFGGAHCVAIDPETGLRTGAADCRRSGAALAY